MKKHLTTSLCLLVIIISCIVIITSLVKMNKKISEAPANQTPYPEFEYGNTSDNPLTEIEFEDLVYDFGILTRDTTVYKNFTMKNSGESPLVLYFVSPDCNCTDYEVTKNIALPGDSIEITLRVDTEGKERKFMVNTIVRVNTEKQMYHLRMTGEIMNEKLISSI